MSWALALFVAWPVAAFGVVAFVHGAQKQARRDRSRGMR